jgi:hypothetical protein
VSVDGFGTLTREKAAAETTLSSPLFEIARVLVRFDHGAGFIVNANYSIM